MNDIAAGCPFRQASKDFKPYFSPELHAALEVSVAHGRVVGVPGDEQHPQARPERAGRVRHLPPVHAAWQTHVGHQQVNPGA